MTAPALERPALELPDVAAPFGDALGESAALDALTANDTHAGGDDESRGADTTKNPSESSATATSTGGGDAGSQGAESERGSTPAAAPSAPKVKPVSKRRLARMSKSALLSLYLSEREKFAASDARVSELTDTVVATRALSSDEVDEDVREMCGDVLGLADAAVQVSVGEQYAEAVALDDDETAHLKKLLARVVKVRAGAAVAKASPEIRLGVAVVSIVLAKFIAYRLAVRTAERAGAARE